MILRQSYLNAIKPFIKKPVIKAITGVRRCGKSTLLLQIMDHLSAKGVHQDNLIYINKELFEFDEIRNYKDLHKYVTAKKHGRGFCYLFVDEIQEIENWEKSIASLLAEKDYDIYITGSNARLLSSDLATLLTGRYMETRMYPFTFSEFLLLKNQNKKEEDIVTAFNLFMKYGGFPGIHALEWNDTAIRQYLQSLYSTILLKDIVIKYAIRDAAMLEKIMEYLISNCGNITSANKISEFVKSQHRKVSMETVQNYILYASNALLMHQVRRYDLKGKRLLESHEKYFLCDTGFSFSGIGFTKDHIPGILENIVLIELLSRGYKINIGKLPEKEIDFVAERNNQKLYIQVTTTLFDSKVIDREYNALESVDDHYPKIVLSLDKGFETSRKGIQWMNIQDFLLEHDK